MSIQKFPLAAIQKVRQYIKSALALADSSGQLNGSTEAIGVNDDVPEPESLDELSGIFSLGGPEEVAGATVQAVKHQWFVSTVNPASTLLKLPGLELKPGFRMVSYLYRMDELGAGMVWAVPEELSSTADLEAALRGCSTLAKLPKPQGALPHFMEAIVGDRSPTSFIIASILRRELQEFGAMGQRCNWGHHRLIDAIPAKVQWVWKGEQAKDLTPKVKLLPNDQAAVEFFTCRMAAPYTIYRHVDQYPTGLYKSNGVDQSLAIAQR